MLEQRVVKVFTTEMGVTGSSLDRENFALDGKKGDIESSTSQVENEDIALLFGLLIKTVGNGSGSGFVDDSEDFETGNGTRVLGSETLRVVEVCRDADGGQQRQSQVEGPFT